MLAQRAAEDREGEGEGVQGDECYDVSERSQKGEKGRECVWIADACKRE